MTASAAGRSRTGTEATAFLAPVVAMPGTAATAFLVLAAAMPGTAATALLVLAPAMQEAGATAFLVLAAAMPAAGATARLVLVAAMQEVAVGGTGTEAEAVGRRPDASTRGAAAGGTAATGRCPVAAAATGTATPAGSGRAGPPEQVPPGAGRRPDQAPAAKGRPGERVCQARGAWAAPRHGAFSSQSEWHRRRGCRAPAVYRHSRLEGRAWRARLGHLPAVRRLHGW